jgi:(2Fe-2S) ferredoxin
MNARVHAMLGPRRHLFVCANRRDGSPLGPGCGERGDALYDALKREVAARGVVRDVWVTKTHCLGICPKAGATVARYPSDSPILTEVEPENAAALVNVERDDVMDVLDDLEELQRKKVLDLARRLKPGLTLEDIQNPHDFPELADPDWHYADGVLTGIASVRSALAARKVR